MGNVHHRYRARTSAASTTRAKPTIMKNESTSITTKSTTNIATSAISICKMIMYDQTYFRGKKVEITADVRDFKDIDFDDAIASIKIEGNCCWTLLTDADYKGDLAVLNGPGEYQSGNDFKEVFKKASSA